MHGKKFLLERAYAGINQRDFFLRLDFAHELEGSHQIETRIEVQPSSPERSRQTFVVRFHISTRKLLSAELARSSGSEGNGSTRDRGEQVEGNFERILRAKLLLSALDAHFGDTLLLRFTILKDQLPVDSLPAQGWIELPIIAEEQMLESGDQVW